jgi:hypothetical protein
VVQKVATFCRELPSMNSSSRTRSNTARRSDDASGIRYFGSEEPEIVAEYSSATASGVGGGDLRKVMA